MSSVAALTAAFADLEFLLFALIFLAKKSSSLSLLTNPVKLERWLTTGL